ncbi:hypothetical protein A5745_22690 [Mycobacterium sp. IS-2888]|uniref:hypothetical protein n=1 Tax=Mycobacterium sp. IS-2888 TaxID=1834159 RepID=UPI00096DE4C7|nr:hypothetical protein [Mycobacterium sp. IS-2888]OMC52918.1 hypothetical protein A5745_22690 [Mycobacterium sp. IS-2888]
MRQIRQRDQRYGGAAILSGRRFERVVNGVADGERSYRDPVDQLLAVVVVHRIRRLVSLFALQGSRYMTQSYI